MITLIVKLLVLSFLLLFRDVLGRTILNNLNLKDPQGYLSLIIGGIITIGYIFIAFGYYKKEKFNKSFSKQKPTKGIFALAIITILVLKVIPLVGLMAMFGIILHKPFIFKWSGDIIATFFLGLEIILIGPIVEELSYRGVIYSGLRTKLPLIWSLLISALIFAFPHSGNIGTIFSFVVGMVLAYVYEKTGSLRYPIIFHALLNFFTFAGNFISFR